MPAIVGGDEVNGGTIPHRPEGVFMRLKTTIGAVSLAIAIAACSEGSSIVSAPRLAPVAAQLTEYDQSNSGQYICSLSITPSSQAVTAYSNAYFSVQKNICDRSTMQFLYTDTRGTYWGTSNTSISSVGSAGNNATVNVTVTTSGPGTVTIDAGPTCCGYNYYDLSATATLTINSPLSVSISGDAPGGTISTGTFTWTATASGGTGSYAYAWSRRNFCDSEYQSVGSGSTYTESTVYGQDPFWLQATVTTPSGTATTYHHVGGFVTC
jgi:hypothetical protein